MIYFILLQQHVCRACVHVIFFCYCYLFACVVILTLLNFPGNHIFMLKYPFKQLRLFNWNCIWQFVVSLRAFAKHSWHGWMFLIDFFCHQNTFSAKKNSSKTMIWCQYKNRNIPTISVKTIHNSIIILILFMVFFSELAKYGHWPIHSFLLHTCIIQYWIFLHSTHSLA